MSFSVILLCVVSSLLRLCLSMGCGVLFFSVTSAWEVLKPRHPKVPWACLILFGGNIPRHSFCVWLVVKDKLSQWGGESPLLCLLCGVGTESRDHLFF